MSTDNPALRQLHDTALKAPSSSGVYMWRDPKGTVIYVGKAKNLKNRLSSYFSGQKDIKTTLLISHARTIEYITTANEYEAFLLENNLIKKHSPRYNICLKDGKSYPILRITSEKFPRLFKTRSVINDGSIYYGPFPDVPALDAFIESIYRTYPIRHCKTFREREFPCMYYHIGRCKAPCCKKISKESYSEFFGEIHELLEGKGEKSLAELERQMKEAAKALNFEKAARIRDGIQALKLLNNQNIVEDFSQEDRDYIACFQEGELVSFTVLKIREGKLQGRDNYRVTSFSEGIELMPEFISAYYTDKKDLPPAIYVPTQTGLEVVNRWIHEILKADTNIILVTDDIPNASRHKAAVEMACQNAREDIIRRLRERGDTPAMEELMQALKLSQLPVRIEGFDIAHIGGKLPVASLISFYNGNPDKKNYRYFRLKTTDGLIDDFASMKEAVTRRYTRVLNEGEELPDLLLIDGGIGQVNAVDAVLKALGINIPVAGLAKKDEEIWRPYASKPIKLPKRSDALRLLQRVRDETHRFATTQNQKLRTKFNTQNYFEQLPHIGKKRAAIILKEFTTLENFCAADSEKISQTAGITLEHAEQVLTEAKAVLAELNDKKDTARLSLGASATTAQKAADLKQTADLANLALQD